MKLLGLLAFVFLFLHAHAQYTHDSIPVDGGHLHYYTTGQGDPLVLMQGGPGFSSYYMRAIADSIPNHQCILIDYRGTGHSLIPRVDTSTVSIDSIISDVERVRLKLGISKWTILGHSYGSMLAMYYATRHPKQTKEIISVSSAGTNNQFQRYYGKLIAIYTNTQDRDRLQALYADTTGDPAIVQEMLTLEAKSFFYDKSKASHYIASIPPEEGPYFFSNDFFLSYISRSDFWTFDISKEVYRMKTPLLLIESRFDPCYDGRQLLIAERSKNASIHMIEDSGHFPWAEQPSSFFKVVRKALMD